MERRTLKKKLYLSGIDGRAAQLARENGLGYEIADFCYAPVLEDPARRAEVRAQMAGIDRFWLHAPFAELAPCAIDPLVREVTRTRYRQTVRLARELGVNRLIIHGGFVPQVYFPEWYIEQSVQFWREFLRELPDGMTVALENVMEPEPSLLAEIARQVDDARLGLCLDVGHANTFVSHVPPLEWIAPMAPWLRHVHIHNNAGQMDLHDPLGKGVIQMERVLDEIVRLAPAAKDMMFLSHASYEVGYRLAADELGLEPCLLLGMRLGEGSGCPLMFRVLQGACAVLRDMATFAEGEIQDDYLAPIRAMDAFTVENT